MQQDAWLRAHVAVFNAFGGSAPRIACDNLKTGGVSHPRRWRSRSVGGSTAGGSAAGHVVFERNFYSAPLAQIGTIVDLRITARTLEIYRGTE